jgi:uncharacterized membrane protein
MKIKKLELTALFIIIISFSIIYSFIGIEKHIHFQTFGWDTAIFDQQVYLVSQFKPPFSSLHGFIGLGDHFHPLLYLVGGLAYKIWSNAGMLYIIQSVVACLSAVPLYLSAKYILKETELSSWHIGIVSLSIIFCYLFAASFQFMVTGEYNDAPTVALPLLFSLYFLITRNERGFWVSFILMLFTKEEYSLLSVPVGIYLFIKWRSFKKAAFATILGLLYFFFLTTYLMPKISGTNEYIFFSDSNRPQSIISKFLGKPSLSITKLVDNPEKRKTILASLTSFGFLPLLSPAELIIPTTTLAIRFYDDTLPRRYEFNNQYASGLIPPLAFAAVFGVRNLLILLSKRKISENLSAVLIISFLILTSIYQDLILHGPINALLKKQFYETQRWEGDANELINKVPPRVTVSSQNSLLPHLSERSNFYLLPKIGNSEYIAVDLADGPNKFAPLDLMATKDLINSLITEKKFEVVWQKNQSILLKKI